MTSEELKKTPATDLSTNGWLREICLQLALLNEAGKPHDILQIQDMQAEQPRVKRAYRKRNS